MKSFATAVMLGFFLFHDAAAAGPAGRQSSFGTFRNSDLLFSKYCDRCSRDDTVLERLRLGQIQDHDHLSETFDFVRIAVRGEVDASSLVFFDQQSDMALTAAHCIKGIDNSALTLKPDGTAICRPHPCYLLDDDDRPVAWDIAVCRVDDGVSSNSDGVRIKILTQDSLVEGTKLDLMGYGCSGECHTSNNMAQVDLSVAMLQVAKSQLNVHKSFLRLEPLKGRCTQVCFGDSGGAALAIFGASGIVEDSRTISLKDMRERSHLIGIISRPDDMGFSYISLLDESTREWIDGLRADWNLDASSFKKKFCPTLPLGGS